MDRTGSARRWWTVASLFGSIAVITLANGGPVSMPGGPLKGSGPLPCPHGRRGRARPVNSHQLQCSCRRRCGASWCPVGGCNAITLGRLDGDWQCTVGEIHRIYARRCPHYDCFRLGQEDEAADAFVCRAGHYFRAAVNERCSQCDSGYRVTPDGTSWVCEACDWTYPPARR